MCDPMEHPLSRISQNLNSAAQHLSPQLTAFLQLFDREELCWNLLVSSTKDNKVLWEKMSLIQSDDDLKAYLIDYTWKAAGHLRGEFVAKAHISVPSTYGIGELKHQELEKALKWLLEEVRFIHGENTIFRLLLSVQWWGPKGEGRKWGQKKNPFFNNIPILALIASAFFVRWDHHVSLLENFEKECPSYLEMIWDELKEGVWNGNIPGVTEDTPSTTFNFSALETAGCAAKARKSGTE
ncbi:hypothetical protein EDB19DRAFT_1831178 [Suillus lakei]|nr:hypothetical protein EDB19DRAFT_1831178 [Suillus lakei]